MAVILVVDDEIGIRELLSEILSDEGYGVLLAENASAARSAMTQHPDLVLLDIWMPDNDGVSLLKEWNATGQLNVPVIMMSGPPPSCGDQTERVKKGAYRYRSYSDRARAS